MPASLKVSCCIWDDGLEFGVGNPLFTYGDLMADKRPHRAQAPSIAETLQPIEQFVGDVLKHLQETRDLLAQMMPLQPQMNCLCMTGIGNTSKAGLYGFSFYL